MSRWRRSWNGKLSRERQSRYSIFCLTLAIHVCLSRESTTQHCSILCTYSLTDTFAQKTTCCLNSLQVKDLIGYQKQEKEKEKKKKRKISSPFAPSSVAFLPRQHTALIIFHFTIKMIGGLKTVEGFYNLFVIRFQISVLTKFLWMLYNFITHKMIYILTIMINLLILCSRDDIFGPIFKYNY